MAIRELYPAVVTDSDDPEQRMRIKVKCMGVMGDEDTELPMWIEPAPQWGWFAVPDPGEQVEIEMNVSGMFDESFGQTSLQDADIKWCGVRFYSDDAMPPTPVHDDFKENYGKRRGFATPTGHILFFDDTPGAEQARLAWKAGDNYAFFNIDNQGGIQILSKAADVMVGREDGKQIYLKEATVALGAQSPSDKVALASLVKAQLNGVKADFDATKIHGGSHTHMTALGPSGPPVPPLVLTYVVVEPKSDVVESE